MKKIEFVIGKLVSWTCKPRGQKAFEVRGKLTNLFRKGMVQVAPTSKKYRQIFPNRKTTYVSMKNIQII